MVCLDALGRGAGEVVTSRHSTSLLWALRSLGLQVPSNKVFEVGLEGPVIPSEEVLGALGACYTETRYDTQQVNAWPCGSRLTHVGHRSSFSAIVQPLVGTLST